MSFKATTRNNNMNKTNTKAQQPFCKVCFDAKRDDYNTHYLKDFSGPKPIVLCPYLLALKCNYCKEQGHTVSYCEILKAKKEGEIVPSRYQQQQQKAPSQNGNFFILRVSVDKKETVTHSSRETVSEKKKSVSTTNQFALLGDDDEDEDGWELPKYNKTRKSDIVTAPQEEVAAVAVAIAEPEPIAEFIGTTWAKIAAASPVTKKMTAPVSTTKEVLKKDVASLFVTRSEASTPADYEKPMPKFIHMTPVKSSPTDNVKIEKIEKYFTAPPFTRDWADDDSSSQDDGW